MSLVFDARLCTGCQACQMACMDQRDIRPAEGQTPLIRVEPAEAPGVFRAVCCTQCGTCMEMCPAGCLRREGSLVVPAEALCLGCGICAEACPVGVITFKSGIIQKCDGCAGRRADGLSPACVHTCPTGALQWED